MNAIEVFQEIKRMNATELHALGRCLAMEQQDAQIIASGARERCQEMATASGHPKWARRRDAWEALSAL